MKKAALTIMFLLVSIGLFSQNRRTVIDFGLNNDNFYGIGLMDRLTDNMYVGVEYTWNNIQKKNNLLGMVGWGNSNMVIMGKMGESYTNLTGTKYWTDGSVIRKFDYGVECLWILDYESYSTLAYGISYNKSCGVQLKFGLAF